MDPASVSPHHGRIIALDFDGTCVADAYPGIGPSIGAERVLVRLVAHGAALILWTMRSGETLAEAEAWFAKHNIPLRGINQNPDQGKWTTSPKAHADLYIDDRAFGAPLTRKYLGSPPHINWEIIEKCLFAGVAPENRHDQRPVEKNDPAQNRSQIAFPAATGFSLRRLFKAGFRLSLDQKKQTKQ